VLAPGQEAPRDVGEYRVVQSPTNNVFHAFRVLVSDPKAAETLMAGYQAYPYAQRENPRNANADGSVDIHFGPAAPVGKESNWLPTLPGRGWFGLFRFYAPTEAYFDRSWALPDVERVK
jgi:hypothetical protein